MTQLTAIVTGGSSGIGEGICRQLVESRIVVINVDIKEPNCKPNGNYHFFKADLSDPERTRNVARDIVQKFRVNCLVNNAGNPIPATIEQVTDGELDHSVNLHVRAALIFAQAVLPTMKAAQFGRIINISSRAILGKRARTSYSATKAALVGFTRSWALELGGFGITVNAIAPGPVLTELFRKNNPPDVAQKLVENAIVGRAGTPDDIARAVIFFASPDAGYVTGQVLHVCGGSSLGAALW